MLKTQDFILDITSRDLKLNFLKLYLSDVFYNCGTNLCERFVIKVRFDVLDSIKPL